MLFNSIPYMLFLPAVLLVYYLLPGRFRQVWLLLCSYYFYMCWNAKYLLLILTSTLVTWLCALAIEQAENSSAEERIRVRRKKTAVALGLVLNLGILFFFKYYHFAMDNLVALLSLAGISFRVPAFDVLLPVGISFYTFQALGYMIDVYRGDISAEHNLPRYALFVSFFPQLVAGPIERSKNLLGQLAVPHKLRFENLQEGLYLMLWGFFLKIVLADRIAIFVDAIYSPNYMDYGGITVILATVLFAVQIYCDFAGYSTIAMGSAKMLGVELMENFNTPYLACSVAEFWHRWHISLSTWFRDYLYIPLGGNRKGKLRKALNVMITFTVSGLWHGASWGFVVWGFLNGMFQVVGGWLRPVRQKLARALCLETESLGYRLGQTLVTFALVDLTWVFFRAPSVHAAVHMIRSMRYIKPEMLLNGSLLSPLDAPNTRLLLLSLLLLLLADVLKYRGFRVRSVLMRQDWLFQAIFLAASICAILLFGIWGGSYDAASFIYFQF